MKITTYNINGIRSSMSKGLAQWLENEDADIVCLQEVRANEKVAKSFFEDDSLSSPQISFFAHEKQKGFFSQYNKVYNCGIVSGYAGTMILSKIKPNKVVFGIDETPDNEGRCITLYFDKFAVVNCYVPNGGSRLEYKMEYFEKLTKYLHNLSKETTVIFCSDANIAHTELDLTHPKECSKRTGFLPMERNAMTKLLENHFCDVVRKFKKNQKVYTWRSYRSRENETNFGWKYRFDYILVNLADEHKVSSCNIPELAYSDHLPIIISIDL